MSEIGRTDRAERMIAAPAGRIFGALTDLGAVAHWLPPAGMSGEIVAFEPWEGGQFDMILRYRHEADRGAGKSSDDTDRVKGRFGRMVRDTLVEQVVTFDATDPAFAGVMTLAWQLTPDGEGTRVEIIARNVPRGISAEDHAAGLASSLANLDRYCTQS